MNVRYSLPNTNGKYYYANQPGDESTDPGSTPKVSDALGLVFITGSY